MRTTRRYLGCCTSRCTSTTMVFSIFALVTLPVRMVRSPRSATGALCVSLVITPSLLSALAREGVSSPAPDLFSLHGAASALPLVPSKAGSAAGKSSPSALFPAPAIRPRPLRGSSQYAAASLKPSRAGNELRGNRQLVRRQSQCFLGRRFVHSRHLEHDASRLHHRNPFLRRAFALAHAGFRRLLGERLIRKNPDPQFSPALDEPGNRHTRRFNLPVGDPRAFHGFQPVFTERQIPAAPGLAFAAAAHLLSVLHLLRHQHRCVLASLNSLTSSRLRHCGGFAFLLNLGKLLGHVLALVDPALHADHSVRRVGFRGPEINVRAQRLQRQPPLQVPFLARDFRSVQPPCHAHLDAFAAKAQRRIHRFAHRAPERHAFFELQCNRFRHQGRIQFRPMHFLDVDVHFALGALLHILLELVDFRALAPDDDARPRRVNSHHQLVCSTLDVNRADARALQFLFQFLAELDVFVKQIGIVLVGIPPRLKRLVVAQPESVRVRLLSHSRSPCFFTSCPFSSALVYRSKPFEPGARCRVRPFALRLPPRWLPRVPQPRCDARQRPPKGAQCASGSETPGPSARDAAASSAALHSQNTAPRTACPHPAAHRSLLPCVPHWRWRCATLFRCAWQLASACTSASAKRLEPSARESDPSPDALFAATSVRAAPVRALQSMHSVVSALQP